MATNTNELDYSRKVADGERLELIMRQVASRFKLDGNVLAEALLDIHERLKAVEGATEELTSSDRWKAFKTVQLVKPSPSASGDTVTAIDTVAQDENGELTATKKNIRQGTTSQTGIVRLSNATNSTSTALAATANAVKTAYDLAASKLDKDGLGDDVRVQFTQATTRTNIVTTSKLSVLFGKIQKWFADMGALAFKDTVGTSDVESGTYPIDISGNAATASSTDRAAQTYVLEAKGETNTTYRKLGRLLTSSGGCRDVIMLVTSPDGLNKNIPATYLVSVTNRFSNPQVRYVSLGPLQNLSEQMASFGYVLYDNNDIELAMFCPNFGGFIKVQILTSHAFTLDKDFTSFDGTGYVVGDRYTNVLFFGSKAIGSSSIPTYVNANGVLQPCDPSSMSVGNATTATTATTATSATTASATSSGAIKGGDDLNSYNVANRNYLCNATDASSVSNRPSGASGAFDLEVIRGTGDTCVQVYYSRDNVNFNYIRKRTGLNNGTWTSWVKMFRDEWVSFTPDTLQTTEAAKIFTIGNIDVGYYFDSGSNFRLSMRSKSGTRYVYLADQHGNGGGYALTTGWTGITLYGFTNSNQLESLKGYDTTGNVNLDFDVYYANGVSPFVPVAQYRVNL